MIYQLLIVIFFGTYALPPVLGTSQEATTASSKATGNSTSLPPKQTSYFYRDPEGPGTYEYGYRIEDEATKNIQFRNEKRFANGTVTGSYGYLRPDGKMSVTDYVADEKGFRTIKSKGKHPPTTPSMTTEASGINLNAGTLPPQLVQSVMDQYQIDLSPDASPSEILHPDISDIVNGKVPLTINEKELGFEVVHNFIPDDFPIVSFQLPTELPNAPVNDD